MAAKNWSTVSNSGVEELLFQNDTVSLCLLVNRRHRHLRVVDFRAGPTVAKRNFVIAAAKREGIDKVFTLVERDEVSTWTRLGFSREGSIPAFYRRSDAWILGAVVSQVAPLQLDARDDDDGDDDDDAAPAQSPAAALAERTIARAKRLLKASPAPSLPSVKVADVREADARKAISAAQRSGRALTGFEAFGRDVARGFHVATTRAGFSLHASWETQPCFGNSFLEILTGPRTELDRLATTAAVRALAERLEEEGFVSTFCLAPADDVSLAAVFLANAFRRTGVLAKHLVVKGERRDAIVWSKKLAAGPEA